MKGSAKQTSEFVERIAKMSDVTMINIEPMNYKEINDIISNINTEFICFLNHAEIELGSLSDRETFMQEKKANVCYTNYLNENKEKIYCNDYLSDQLFSKLLVSNPFNISTMMFRHCVFDKVGLLDTTFNDVFYEFILRVSKYFQFHYLDIFSITQHKIEPIKSFKDGIRLKAIEGLDKVDIYPLYSNSADVLDNKIRQLAHQMLEQRCYQTAIKLMERI